VTQLDTETRQAVRRILANHVDKKVEFGDDTPLVSGGLIDSMSLVDLILDLQTAFSVQIAVSQVEPDDFDTVERIAATVARFR
jgi:acyl carrier protein